MSTLEEGHLLGRYRIEAFLAQGGMGRIYRAVDTVLGRRVALKVLADSGRPGSPAIARLLREARAVAALSHPRRPTLWVMDSLGERAPRAVDIGDRIPRDVTVSPDDARFALSVAGTGIAVGALRGEPELHFVSGSIYVADAAWSSR